MTDVPPLFILRHGQTEWNLQGRLQGRFDSPLTDLGRAQAETQRNILRQQNLHGFHAVSSPQGRAMATARIALKDVRAPIAEDRALAEIGLGEWAGKHRAELVAEYGLRDGFDLYDHAPGGEGFAGLRQRVTAFLRRLDAPTVIVTHGMTSRMLRLVLTDRPTAAIREIDGGQGVVFRVENGRQHRLSLRG